MNYQGQEALLLWCKTHTSGYPDVQVQNFHTSWRDGLAFCALIHKFRPESVQMESLSKDRPLDNLEIAFSVALQHGIPRLLDPHDMMIEPRPDNRSIMTYLSQMYHVFERNDNPGMGIANITMVGPAIPFNSSVSETNLTQHQVPGARERPKFVRSLSTSNIPRPATSGPQLQQRIPPLLSTAKTTSFKALAQSVIKKGAGQAPTEQTPPAQDQPPPPMDQASEPTLEQAQVISITTPITATVISIPSSTITSPTITPTSPGKPPKNPFSTSPTPYAMFTASAPLPSMSSFSTVTLPPVTHSNSTSSQNGTPTSTVIKSSVADVPTPTPSFPTKAPGSPVLRSSATDILPTSTAKIINTPASPVVKNSAAEIPSTNGTKTAGNTSPIMKPSPADAPLANGAKVASAPASPVIKNSAGDILTTSGTPALTLKIAQPPVSAPVTLTRSTTNPSISIASLMAGAPKPDAAPPKSAPEETSTTRPSVTSPTPSPIASLGPAPSLPTFSPSSPSLSSVSSPSPSSPSLTSQKVKILSTKSSGNIVPIQKLEEEKSEPKPSTPPLGSSSSRDLKLKRSQSVTNVGSKHWVSAIKGQGNYIKITDPKVEIKKVEVEGDGSTPEPSDDEAIRGQAPSPQSRFMVDKVSSSSRGTWLAKLQHRDSEEEDDDEYEYVDDDPNRKFEPHFNADIKLTSCLMRSTSTGKLTLPTPVKDKHKKVSFRDNLPRTDSKEYESLPTSQTTTSQTTTSQTTPNQTTSSQTTTSLTTTTNHVVSIPRSPPAARAQIEETTPSKEDTKKYIEMQLKANATIKQLERARDEAIFHKDEIAAKYSELELRLKEERAANEAMEKETADLHQKLAAVQEQTEAKFNQKVSDMSQKLADKDREILKLRMQNTTMKKKVEERDRDIEKLKTSRSFSPIPELPIEDLESDLECRQTWENAGGVVQEPSPAKTVSVHSYSGLKISVDTSKFLQDSPRSATASPRYEMMKQLTDSPFSPDLIRRTSTPPLLTKPHTPTKNDTLQVEVAKVSYVTYASRPHTPTKPGDTKFGIRPNTPTKIEIIKKSEVHHSRSTSLEALPRADSQTRITYQIPKSPEPIRAVLSPKLGVRSSSGGIHADSSSGKSGDSKTPRMWGDAAQAVQDAKNEDSSKSGSGTLRSENSKPTITFSSPSPSPGARPTPSPSPSPGPSPSPKPGYTKYPPVRHNSNPHNHSPNLGYAAPRANSNPSPSSTPPPKATFHFSSRNPSSANSSPAQSPSPNPSPSPKSPSPNPGASSSASAKEKDKDKEHHASRTDRLLSFITRGRSNTLPPEMPGGVAGGAGETNGNGGGETHSAPVSLLSPRGGQKIEVGTAKETASEEPQEDDNKPMPIGRIGRSYSLSSLTQPTTLTKTPTYVPPPAQTETKPTWLVNLGRKIKPNEDNSAIHISDESTFSPTETYTLEQLKIFLKTNQYPSPSFDKTKAEWYLNDEMFKKLFTVTKAEYSRFSKWKQDHLKRRCKMDTP